MYFVNLILEEKIVEYQHRRFVTMAQMSPSENLPWAFHFGG